MTGFDLLTQKVATRALHASGEICDPARCHPDTRVAILTDLEEWATGAKYNSRIQWIRGSAGVGKTAIMRSIAEILERRKLLLATFFFWRTGDRCNTAEFLVPTLAYQIAISVPGTRYHINRAIEENPLIFTQTLEAQSRALIVEPLIIAHHQSVPRILPRIFVIDGLDECQDAEKQCEVLNVLNTTLKEIPAPTALLVASRPENPIRKIFNTVLKGTSSSRLLDASRNANADIRRFYVAKFREIRYHHPLKFYLPSSEWPLAVDITLLVERASGQFIYAATVAKFVAAPDKNPASQLKIVLESREHPETLGPNPFPSLDALYSTIFSAISSEDIQATLRIIGVLLFPQRLTFSLAPPSFWENLLGLRDGEIRRLLIGLESLVSIRESDTEIKKTVHFYHASLADFLSDPKRSGPFFMDEGMVCEDLARCCITHLSTNDDDVKQYIVHNMESIFCRAKPTMGLYQAIEKVGTLYSSSLLENGSSAIRPHFLKYMFPTLLHAILKSSLPAKDKLYSMKLKDYRLLISQVLPHYFRDEHLAFLTLGRVSLDFNYWSVLPFDDFIDEVCPLPIESKTVDREGFCLYRDAYWHDLRLFTETAKELIETMPACGRWFSTAALRLLQCMDSNSRYEFLVCLRLSNSISCPM
ncbi:hypothetical protein GALMADRAFT_1245504 [Galerina marginata CBS 339.88]|uniref:NACHT domain-containing protein n=1 Tax=Galerina marginata (strain CBS 339.88) TaxID=685588 RepID=A0A067T8R7_GALM3|nr:hypothetical protein GALMADRAFT_1245504 [Galerina marginata CBS 339.88]